METKRHNIFSIFIRITAVLLIAVLLGGCAGKEEETKKNNNRPNSTQADKFQSKYSKNVALTFDDGPHNVRTKKIVDELSKYGYHATFFVVGNRVAAVDDNVLVYDGAEAMKYAYENGNEIGIHGYTHGVYYNNCDEGRYKWELADTKTAIQKVAKGAKVKLMRPIGGAITEDRVEDCPYSVIMWSVDSEDWKYKGAADEATAKENVDIIVNNVMSQVKNGDIILMHDIYDNTYEATKIILKKLNEQGYGVLSVSELLGNIKAGKKYSRLAVTEQNSNAVQSEAPSKGKEKD